MVMPLEEVWNWQWHATLELLRIMQNLECLSFSWSDPRLWWNSKANTFSGKGRALEIMMTGRKIDSKEALDIGLINYVVKQHELRNFVNKFCMTILANSSNSFKHLIKSVNSYFNENQDGFKTELNEFSKCFESDDFKEGIDAFLNKRKPNFK